ncbi:uncharacterized protein METZ01_LOCUS392088 [marine metagenome]|uniref:Uncharacterized protein n=1 Tax=marine metagenome TaxID=408172 RepID=A0A382UYB5_9ZZZZ
MHESEGNSHFSKVNCNHTANTLKKLGSWK